MKYNGYTMQHVMAGILVLCVAGLFSWQRLTPLTVLRSEISPTEIYSGDRLIIVRDYQWHRSDCSNAYVLGWITDALGFTHTLSPQNLGKPNLNVESHREWPTQFVFPAGKSIYKATIVFSCPPFYSFWPNVIDLPNLDFKILESPIKQGIKKDNGDPEPDPRYAR